MNNMTRRSHQMQKHKFDVMCPGALFMESALGPPENERKCIDVSCTGRTCMHYVTRISHRMQKCMFGVTCPDVLFCGISIGPTRASKLVCRHFAARTHQNVLCDP
jgi:hypothetical protein